MAEIIGFIGLGNMGYPMAGNVRKQMSSNATLLIYDIVPSVCMRFVEEFGRLGPVRVAKCPKEVATEAKTVVSIVPAGKHVEQVYLDHETGIISAPKDADRLLLECSTIDIKTAKEVAAKLCAAESGIYVDSPVSGGVAAAAAGTLAFMIGCKAPTELDTEPTSKQIKKLVAMMANPEKVFFTGSLGTGLGAKIANNYITFCIIEATAEAMSMGVRAGIDPEILYKVVKASSGSSWHLDINPAMPNVVPTAPSSRGFTPAFKPFMAVKDLGLGIDALRNVGINPICGEAAMTRYKQASEDSRYKNLDCTSIWLLINEEGN